ncbi:NADPH-dependent FMN reductase [Kitasatospora phosalacinea]|uniref:NADPH-dependent FMN reductase n=1 Tax=Kitasatospora phosalacinea TaxID=2065 RepID=UPI001FD7437B|nr:NADPH-dependent FMN reductase [Kitasatospora phosalacinea]
MRVVAVVDDDTVIREGLPHLRLFIGEKTDEERTAVVTAEFADFLRDRPPADLEREPGLGPGDLLDHRRIGWGPRGARSPDRGTRTARAGRQCAGTHGGGDGETVDFVAIVGSLRAGSLNRQVALGAADLCGPGTTLTLYEGLADLPYFEHDVEVVAPPAPVLALRARLAAADAVLITCPEYAAGMSGVLKNALEWVVGGGELVDKPVAVVTASPATTGGERARAWTTETLRMMGADVLPESMSVPLAGTKLKDGRIRDETLRARLGGVLAAMEAAAVRRAAERED